ncbi:MAG: CoA-binding protein [Candidatus Nanohaloarchaea archaeon]|nr:CoA-binding protein [Candidatus Nanohaloarchaea archaeon]
MTDSNLDSFFTPDSLAIVGASRQAGKIGHTILRNFSEGNYQGDVYAVNPNADEVLGYECYDSVKDIESVELAVIAVPPQVANSVIEECIDAGVAAVTVVTAGYEEIGGEGQKRQDELEELLEGTATRLLGPNCLGVWDAYSDVDTLFLPDYKLNRPPQGSIALISQSGAVGSSVLDMAAEMDIGISRFISYGNQADVTETELLEWLADDDKTDAIAVYMEGVEDGDAFYEQAQQVSEEKPVVVLKAGKSGKGSEAASSHTGSLAGSYEVYRGAFRQTGIVEAQDVEDLFDRARALAYERPPDGKNVAVITNGGGYGVLSTDKVERSRLEMASFADETKEKLANVLPDYGTPHNPLDVIGDADVERYEKALEIVSDDPNVDAILCIALLQPVPLDSDIIETLTEFNDSIRKPMVACMVGGEFTNLHLKNLEHNRVPTFKTPESAIEALEGLHMYGEWVGGEGEKEV